MRLENHSTNASTDLPTYISPTDDEFLQCMQRRLVEISQNMQHLQNSGQAETFEMEWLALHLHLSIIKTMITERLEGRNGGMDNGNQF